MLDLPPSLSAQLPYLIGAVLAYLLGSIPFGLVLTSLAGLGDIRKVGSGSIGATNVLRTGRKGLAAATVLLDGGKGTLAALLGYYFGGPDMAIVAAGAVVLGHCFPVWLNFKGGKGVATALGVLLGLDLASGVLSCITWLVIAAIFRYSSLAGLAALALSPVYLWYLADVQRAELAVFVAALVWMRHHQNIRRLMKGEEPRIGASRK